jgi:Tfp pilus assembly protein PilV
MRPRGTSIIEAIVAAGLGGIAVACLAASTGVATRTLRLARETAMALALASARVESLRAGPRADGTDAWTSADGTRFDRDWTATGGRGLPARLDARVRWRTHAVQIDTETMP